MSGRPAPVALSIVVLSLVAVASVRAECVYHTAKQVMDDQYYELIFRGTVVTMTRTTGGGYEATFDVDRVWKGSVSKRFDMYLLVDPGFPRLEVGKQYLILATKVIELVDRERVGLAGTDTVAFMAARCSDERLLKPDPIPDLGPGQPPKG
jgi:hypothetical protein